MKTAKQKRDELVGIRTAMYALAGGSVVFLFKVVECVPIEGALLVALYCFVIGIPLLIALGLCAEVMTSSSEDMPESAEAPFMALWLAPYAPAIGVGAFIWHYNIGAAVAYCVAVTAAFVCWIIFMTRLGSTPHDGSNVS
jgi:hypothetical protein